MLYFYLIDSWCTFWHLIAITLFFKMCEVVLFWSMGEVSTRSERYKIIFSSFLLAFYILEYWMKADILWRCFPVVYDIADSIKGVIA